MGYQMRWIRYLNSQYDDRVQDSKQLYWQAGESAQHCWTSTFLQDRDMQHA